MRIIAGKYRSRRIQPPRNLPVRPTTDMARESLFNILGNLIDFKETQALDLFSGTGAISFELISRGCQTVTAVDRNRDCVRWIQKAAGDFQMDTLRVRQADTFRFLRQSHQKYDLIFADPPYDMENIAEISRLVFSNRLLNNNGWLVIEHPKTVNFAGQDFFHSHRKYGKVNFSFFHFVTDEK